MGCLACFQTTLMFEKHDKLSDNCMRWVRSTLRVSHDNPLSELLPTPLTGSDQTGQNHDCFSSQAWPKEIKPQVGLMPAGTINLLFIAKLMDHHKASVKGKKRPFWRANYSGFTVIRMIAPMNPPCEPPGLKEHLTFLQGCLTRETCRHFCHKLLGSVLGTHSLVLNPHLRIVVILVCFVNTL